MMNRAELMKNLDLLIVEDDENMARSENRQLKKFWSSITFAKNAQEGLEAINSGKFDVVLTDWDCPCGGGEQVVRDSDIPIVVHTGNSEVQNLFHDARVVMKPARSSVINNALVEAYLKFEIGKPTERKT